MRPKRRGTKNDAATNQRMGTKNDNILILLLVLMIGVFVSNFIVGNQLAINTTLHVEVTDKGVALHPTTTNQSPELIALKLSKHFATDDINKSEKDVFSGADITKIITGELPFPTDCSDGSLNKRCRLKFKPGTVQLSNVQTLQQCYVDTNKYKAHIESTENPVMTSISHKHKIIFRNIPKSASSTARHAMFDFLDGKDYALPFDMMMNLATNHNYSMISFIREPMSRFYSSYDEAFWRMGPWMDNKKQPILRRQYRSVKYKVDKYPYLYEGMNEINDYRKMYCPKEVLDTGVFLDCDDHDSIDDGRLLKRFEQFVHDYDGIKPFDIHLNMQTTNLIYENGKPLPITALYNASNADKDWQQVASQHGVTIADGEMKHGRRQSRRFDVSKVSDATQQKICQILLLDYCCLNFKLPKVCDDVGLYCSLEQMEGQQMEGQQMWKKDDSLNVVIRPWENRVE